MARIAGVDLPNEKRIEVWSHLYLWHRLDYFKKDFREDRNQS